MECLPVRERVRKAGAILLKSPNFTLKVKTFYDNHPTVKYLGDLEMFQEYAAAVAVGYYENKNSNSSITVDKKIDREFIESIDLEKQIDLNKYRTYSSIVLKNLLERPTPLGLKDSSGKTYYPVKGNEWLYTRYGIIDSNGKLKKYSYPVALRMVEKLNSSTNYRWGVKGLTQEDYTVVVIGTRENLERQDYYDIALEEPQFLDDRQKEDLKSSIEDFLIKDGDYVIPAYKQKEIVNSIGAIVYSSLLSFSSERRIPVSTAFKQARNKIEEVKEYYEKILEATQSSDSIFQELKNKLLERNRISEYNALSSFENIKQLEEVLFDINTLLKENVWVQVEKHVKRSLQKLGIIIKKDTVENSEQTVDMDDTEDLDSVESVLEGDFSNEKNYNLESFHLDPRNTTTINVKLFLSQIPAGKTSYLGISLYLPFDTVFDELKRLLNKVTPDIDSYISTLEELGDSGKPYLKFIADKLKDPKVSVQFKNQFVTAMNVQENDYTLLLWSVSSSGQYTAKIINANRNSAYIRVLEEWNEQLKDSSIAINREGRIILDTGRLIELKNRMINLQGKEKTSKEEYSSLMYELLEAIGISTNKTLNKILLQDDYSTFGNKVRLSGNFKSQFHFTKQGYPLGAYSALADSLIKVSRELEKPENEKLTLDDINPYIKGGLTHGYIISLARLFAQYSEVLSSSSYRGSDGKIRYVYSFHTPVTNRIRKLNDPNSNLKDVLGSIPFSKKAFWLRNEYKHLPIEVTEFDAMKEEHNRNAFPKERTNMERIEHDFFTANLFFGSMEKDRSFYISTTLSDRKRSYIFVAPKLTIRINPNGIILDEKNQITITNDIVTENTKEYIYDIVESELSRMRTLVELKEKAIQGATNEQERKKALQELKDDLGEQFYEGANYFYLYPRLNKFIYDSEGNFLVDKINDPDAITKMKGAAFEYIVDEINNTIKNWIDEGLLKITSNVKTGKISCSSIVSSNYLNIMEGDDLQKTVGAITNMVINYHLTNASTIQLLYGDPALAYNPHKFNSLPIPEKVKSTMDEYQKRGAKDGAPGELGNTNWTIQKGDKIYKGSNYYKVAFIKDDNHGTLTPGLISEIEAYSKKLNRTDSQELTTVLEHINVLMNYGKISEKVYTSIREKIEKAGPGGYYKLTEEELSALEEPVILQPQKPVQIDYIQEGAFERIYYIKTSSFPLIPELTANKDIDKLRIAMEKKGVDRAVFITGVKLGANNVVEIFNSDGTIKDDIDFKDKEIHTLNRENFYIQQDIPYREDKDEITVSSQMDRLIVDALEGMINFKLKGISTMGNTMSGDELLKLKESAKIQLEKLEKENLYSELGIKITYDDELGTYRVEYKDLNKLSEKLIEFAKEERGWDANDLAALKVKDGKFILSPGLGNAYEKIESLINSLMTKTVRIHIHGTSSVQGSSSGFRNPNVKSIDELSSDGRDGIVWVKNSRNEFDPSKELKFIINENGNITYAQILLPWRFKASLKDFIDPPTNTIDLSNGKIDPELLRIVSFRLPNQGYSSQLVMEIVGFLPKQVGDLAIVPGEITEQMGSDFDVDKLYSYIYNHLVNENGKLVKIPEFIEQDGSYSERKATVWLRENFPTKFENLERARKLASKLQEASGVSARLLELFDENVEADYERITPQDRKVLDQLGFTLEDIKLPSRGKIKKMSLQNLYIAIHETILSDPRIVEQMVIPLETKDLQQTAEDIIKHKPTTGIDIWGESYLSRNRQFNDYIKQRDGKAGIAFYARAGTGTSVASHQNLHLINAEGDPVTFGFFADDDGNILRLGKLSGRGESFFKGERRTGLKNIITLQSGAVDNAKNPVLSKNNLNYNTFSASLALTVLTTDDGKGLDLRYTSYFLNQPIILEFLREYEKNTNSIGESFISSATGRNITYEYLVDRYSSKIRDTYPDWDITKLDVYSSGFTPKQLLSFMENPNENSLEYLESQIKILSIFRTLDSIGQELMDLYKLLGISSKGIPMNYWKLQDMINSHERFLKGFSSFTGAIEVLNTPQTKHTIDTLYENKALLESLFPVNTTIVRETISNVEKLSRTPLTSEVKREIWLSIRSYIYSNLELFGITEDFKRDLLIGDNSLVNRVRRFMETEESKKFTLLKVLEFKRSADRSLPDLVLYRASSSERVDEYEKVKYFIDMLISDNPTAVGIARDLVIYAYITGGNQEALQFVKFIPVEYLRTIGFGDKVIDIFSKQMDENTFSLFSETILEQYLQHNPARAFRLSDKNPNLIYNGKTGILRVDTSSTEIGEQESAPYVTFYDRRSRSRKLLKLLKIEADTAIYKEIPLLGGTGKDYNTINEYRYGTFNRRSLFPYNNPSFEKTTSPDDITNSPSINTTKTILQSSMNRMIGELKNTNSVDIEEFFKKLEDISKLPSKEILQHLEDLVEVPRFKAIMRIVSANSSILKNLTVKIVPKISYRNRTPLGLYSENTISLAKDTIIERSNRVKVSPKQVTEKVLAHEMVHAVVTKHYEIYKNNPQSPLLSEKVRNNLSSIDKIRRESLKKLSKEEIGKIKQIAQGKTEGISPAELSKLYGFINGNEFIAEALTNRNFQEKLNSIRLDDGTVLERFIKEIIELFKEIAKVIGIDVKTGSALEATLVETLDLVHNIEETIEETATSILIETYNFKWAKTSKNSYEVSSAGDKRFSALFAKLKDGRTIEEAYQLDIKGYRNKGNDWRLGKGRPPLVNISREQLWNEYKKLWEQYLNENPELEQDLLQKAKGRVLTDKFASTDVSQARALAELLNERHNKRSITEKSIQDIKEESRIEETTKGTTSEDMTAYEDIAVEEPYEESFGQTPEEFINLTTIPASNTLLSNLKSQIELKYKTVNNLIIQAREEVKKGNEEKATDIKGRIQKVYLEISNLKKYINTFKSDINIDKLMELASNQLIWVESLVDKENILPSEIIEAFRIIETWEGIEDIIFGEELHKPDMEISPTVRNKINAIKSRINSKDLNRKLFDINATFLSKISEYNSISDFLKEMYNLKDISTVNAYSNFMGDMGVKLLAKLDRLNREATVRVQGELSSWMDRLKKIENLEKEGKLDILWQRDSNGRLTGGLINKYAQSWYNALKTQFGKFHAIILSPKISSAGKISTLRKLSDWINKETVYIDMRFLEKDNFRNEKGQNFKQHYNEVVSKIGRKEAEELLERAKESFAAYKIDLDNYMAYMESQIPESIVEEKERQKFLTEARNRWIRTNSPLVWIRQINQDFSDSSSITISQETSNKYVYYVPLYKYKDGKSTGYYDTAYEEVMKDSQIAEAYDLIKDFMTEIMSYLPNYLGLQSNFLPRVHKQLVHDLSVNGLWTALIKAPEDFVRGITERVEDLNIEGEESAYEKMTKKIPVKYTLGLPEAEMSRSFSRILPLFAKEALNYKWKIRIQDTVELAYKFLNDISDSSIRKEMSSDDLKNIRNSLEWFMDVQLYQTGRLNEGVSKIKTFIGSNKLSFEIVNSTIQDKEDITAAYSDLRKKYSNDDAIRILKERYGNKIQVTDAKEQYKKLRLNMVEVEEKFERGEIDDKKRDELLKILEDKAKVLGRDLVWSKVADKAMAHNQAMMFWFNPFTAFNNYAFGIVSNLIWSESGVDFTRKNVYKAVLLMWKSIFNLKDGKMDKIAQLMNKFDMMKERLEYQSQTQSETLRKMKDFPYILLRKGDYFIKGVTLVSAMLHKKITVTIDNTTKEISLFDAFDEHGNWKTQELGENKDWSGDFSEAEDNQEFIKFKTFVQSLAIKLHGNYDPNTMPMFKKYVVLRMLGQVRASWMIEGVKSRFEKRRFDEFLGREVEGRYITLSKLGILKSLKVLGKLALEHIGIPQDWNTLPAKERNVILENMRKNFAEIKLYALMLATYLLLKASIDDDDEDPEINVTLNILNRVMQDTTFYLSPKTFVEIIKDPLPLLGLYLRAARGFSSAVDLIMKDELTDREVEQDWKNIASNFYFINQYVKFENLKTKIY